jgi:hypothetical protein
MDKKVEETKRLTNEQVEALPVGTIVRDLDDGEFGRIEEITPGRKRIKWDDGCVSVNAGKSGFGIPLSLVASPAASEPTNGQCLKCGKLIGPLCQHIVWFDEFGAKFRRHAIDCTAEPKNEKSEPVASEQETCPKCGSDKVEVRLRRPDPRVAWHTSSPDCRIVPCDYCTDPWHSSPIPPQHGTSTLFDKQQRVVEWGIRCFGVEQMDDPKVRGLRLVEEAIEFCQAVEADSEKLHKLIDYVYSRPAGKPEQELGGVGVTWLAAARSIGTSAEDCLDVEIARIFTKTPEHFAARNQNKVDLGFGPAPVAPSESQAQPLMFVAKPVPKQVIQWTGENLDVLKQWGAPVTILPATGGSALIVGTLEDGPNCEATHIASKGDYIVRGVNGEFYPVKPDIFAASYDPAPAAVETAVSAREWREGRYPNVEILPKEDDTYQTFITFVDQMLEDYATHVSAAAKATIQRLTKEGEEWANSVAWWRREWFSKDDKFKSAEATIQKLQCEVAILNEIIAGKDGLGIEIVDHGGPLEAKSYRNARAETAEQRVTALCEGLKTADGLLKRIGGGVVGAEYKISCSPYEQTTQEERRANPLHRQICLRCALDFYLESKLALLAEVNKNG